MTNEEFFIGKVAEKFAIESSLAKEIYKAVNAYDWAVFCSYMGDYDHPGERYAAKQKIDSYINGDSIKQAIFDFMEKDTWYDDHFHSMTLEYEEFPLPPECD